MASVAVEVVEVLTYLELAAHRRRAYQQAHDHLHAGDHDIAAAYLDHAVRLSEVLAEREAETLALLEAQL